MVAPGAQRKAGSKSRLQPKWCRARCIVWSQATHMVQSFLIEIRQTELGIPEDEPPGLLSGRLLDENRVVIHHPRGIDVDRARPAHALRPRHHATLVENR